MLCQFKLILCLQIVIRIGESSPRIKKILLEPEGYPEMTSHQLLTKWKVDNIQSEDLFIPGLCRSFSLHIVEKSWKGHNSKTDCGLASYDQCDFNESTQNLEISLDVRQCRLFKFRSYKVCLTVGEDTCSKGFSFDRVTENTNDNSEKIYDYDYNERVSATIAEEMVSEEYVDLSFFNHDLINMQLNQEMNENIDGDLESLKNEMNISTIAYEDNDNNKLFTFSQWFPNNIFNQTNQKQNNTIKNEHGYSDMVLLFGRILEFCLLILIAVTSILCIFLLCAIKFC